MQEIIKRIEYCGNKFVLILCNEFEIELTKIQVAEIKVGMMAEVELYKNQARTLTVNGMPIFAKGKEQILQELENKCRDVMADIEEAQKVEIKLESNKRIENLLPIFKIRVQIMQLNEESSMRYKDWRRELKVAEVTQKIFYVAKDYKFWERFSSLNTKNIEYFYPDFKDLSETEIMDDVRSMANALFADCKMGFNPEDSSSVIQGLVYLRTLKVPNVIGEEIRIKDIVQYGLDNAN